MWYSIFMLILFVLLIVERVLVAWKYNAERIKREKLEELVRRVDVILCDSPELNNYDVDDQEAARLNDAINEAVDTLDDYSHLFRK